MTVEVRVATVADAAGIARAHVRSWQAAYRGQIPDEILDGLSIADRRRVWTGQLESGARVLVAADDDVVGFVAFGRTRDDDAGRDTGEIYAAYVLPGRWGRGVGGRLMGRAAEELAGAGYERATLWVLETNERTRRFYEGQGWRPDGARKTDEIDGTTLHEVRYVTELP